jgi:hypothetical protein
MMEMTGSGSLLQEEKASMAAITEIGMSLNFIDLWIC